MLLDIEEQIKPLSRDDKQELFRFLARELQQEAIVTKEDPAVQDDGFQPDASQMVQMTAAAKYPYWPLHDAHDAAKTLLEVSQSDQPAI